MTEQAERAVARRTDPGTSWAAAASVTDIRQSQQQILHIFETFGPMTDEQLIRRARLYKLPHSESGIRTRRSELVRLGYVQDSGERGKTAAGRKTVIWERRD